MTSNQASGVILAAAAAALFSTANIATAAEYGTPMNMDQVKCSGVNACKGMTECATATNSCKGKNSCKGQGWMHMSKTECDAKGGTVMEEKK